MLRAPVSLSRMRWSRDTPQVLYAPKGSDDDPEQRWSEGQSIDPLEFVARVITQIPEPRKHLTFYYGRYANLCRGRRLQSQRPPADELASPLPAESVLSPARKAALRRRWAHLIRRVFEVDPLLGDRCGGQLRLVAFITEPRVIRRILEHLRQRQHSRAPPPRYPATVSA